MMDSKILILISVSYLLNPGLCQKQEGSMSISPQGIPLSATSYNDSPELEPVFVTISPLHRTTKHGTVIVEKEIQLNWYPGSGNDSFDTVVLYTQDPILSINATPVVSVKVADYPSGFYQTNVSISSTPLPGGWENASETSSPQLGEQCMPFWVGTVAHEVPQFLTCLKIQPSWMYDHRDILGHLSILSLLIPGALNSACYKKIDLSNIGDIVAENSITQDVDVWGQLVYGVRYINLQTSYYARKKKKYNGPLNPKNFFVNNDVIQIRPLLPILQDIRKFLEMSQHEIIFLDFERFPVGMKTKCHKTLIELLDREFGDIAFPRPEYFLKVPTLNSMWKKKKQIIIFYGEPNLAQDSPILWQPLHHFSGRMQTLSSLHHYISDIMASSEETTLTRGLWNIKAHLSPDPLALCSHPEQMSFRTIADSSNRNISDWFAQMWWRNASIVSTDFFLNTNMVNIAIQANIYRGLTTNGSTPEIQYNTPVNSGVEYEGESSDEDDEELSLSNG